MRALRRFAPLAAALLFLGPVLADDAATEKRIFWKISSDKGDVFLVGSVHMGNKSMKMPKEVDEAFDKSTSLVVEVDPAKAQSPEIMQKMQEKMSYGADDSLDKHISKETYKSILDYYQENGIPESALKKQKPWVVSLMITVISFKKAGFDADNGIDKKFLEKAKKKDKKIDELETAEFQLDLLADMADDIAEKGIKKSLAEGDKTDADIKDMIAAWKAGDAKKLDEICTREVKKDPDLQPFWKKLVDDRNVKMAEKIEGFLKEKGPTFVCVGAMHCVGEKGIISILEKTGKYKIEPVKVTPVATKKEEKEPAGSGAK
jgi:uncharacterized protein YbaP (TraB family)